MHPRSEKPRSSARMSRTLGRCILGLDGDDCARLTADEHMTAISPNAIVAIPFWRWDCVIIVHRLDYCIACFCLGAIGNLNVAGATLPAFQLSNDRVILTRP